MVCNGGSLRFQQGVTKWSVKDDQDVTGAQWCRRGSSIDIIKHDPIIMHFIILSFRCSINSYNSLLNL